MRYGAPIWVSALQTKRNRTILNRTFRLAAMRVTSAYRTISMEAVCVIAGMVPIEIILREDSECYKKKVAQATSTKEVRMAQRIESMRKWQQEWEVSLKGRWTYRLIPNIQMWVDRKIGEVNFHLTQFMSGHGCYRQYLHRIGYAGSPYCPECDEIEETPEHVVFECTRFAEERTEMFTQVGIELNAGNVVSEMIKSEMAWNAVNKAVIAITTKLQQKWREDQRHQ